MKKNNFTKNAPGKVITTLNGYDAFIPHPLPPRITWSNELLQALSYADRALAKLSEVGSNFPVPQVVMRLFIRKEAVWSSQIEGTRASFRELLTYEARQLSLFGETEDVKEVHNYVKALNYGLERLDALPFSSRLIREIHGILMQGVRGEAMTPGEYRTSQSWIGRPGATIESATFVPPPVAEMNRCLSDLDTFIHQEDSLPTLLKIGLIHYQFEAIHPFLDGNGRVGRLLITLLLVKWGLLSQPLLYLSNFIETNRQEYYDRLLAVSQKGAWEEWLLFFLEGTRSQAEDASRRIAKLRELREKYHQVVSKDRSRRKLERLIDYLIGTPITSITWAQEALLIGSFTTIQRLFEKLSKKGILEEMTGKARNRLYRAAEILGALEDQEGIDVGHY